MLAAYLLDIHQLTGSLVFIQHALPSIYHPERETKSLVSFINQLFKLKTECVCVCVGTDRRTPIIQLNIISSMMAV